MHRLFGKPKPKVAAPTLSDATGSINARTSEIDKKIAGLDNELRKYKEQLKRATGPTAAGIKRRAMETLKRKKMYETQRDQMANQAFNIDQTAFAIETVQNTQTTVAAMSAAAKTLKKEQKKININDIENMQDEMEDLLEDVGEISDILGRSYGTPDGIDEEDLDAELACLEDEWDAEELDTGATSESAAVPESASAFDAMSLPSQPTAAPHVFAGATAAASKPAENVQASPHSLI